MIRPSLLAILLLAGCSQPEAAPDADPGRARRRVADCDRRLAHADCDAARARLAEARRRERMAAYAETMRESGS